MSHEKDVERGRMAQAVLDNPVYAESYGLIEKELTKKWRDARDVAEREHIHQLLRMLDKARSVLEATMASGKVAAKELEYKRSLADKALSRVGLRREAA